MYSAVAYISDTCMHGHPWKLWGKMREQRGRLVRVCIKCRSIQQKAAYAAKKAAK